MAFGLPNIDEGNWGQKVNDSINAVKTTADAALPANQKGAASGVAPLDSGSRVPEANLPANLAAAELAASFVTTVVISGTGIDPTGVTDSKAAIQAKINGAAAGSLIMFPRGTFALTGGLTVPAGLTVRGAGKNATTVKFLTTNIAEHVFEALGSNVTFSDLTVDGNYVAGGAGTKHGICANPTSAGPVNALTGLVVRDVNVTRVGSCGVYFNQMAQASIRNVTATLFKYTGIYVGDRCTDVLVHGCKTTGGQQGILADGYRNTTQMLFTYSGYRITVSECHTSSATGAGVYLNGSVDSKVIGCTAYACGDIGIDLEFCTNTSVVGCNVDGNTGGNYGIACFNPNQKCALTNNVVRRVGGQAGIAVLGVASVLYGSGSQTVVTGNNSSENTGNGIMVGANTLDVLVNANVASDNGWAGIVATYYGVDAPCAGHVISNNVVTNNVGPGIYTRSVSNVVVSGNTARNNSSNPSIWAEFNTNGGGIVVDTRGSAATNDADGKNPVITANTAANNTGPGIRVINSSGATIIGNNARNNSTHGISTYGCDYSSITGNVARNNNGATTGTGSGISVDSAYWVSVTSNTTIDDRGGGAKQVNGISFNTTVPASCQHITAHGNQGTGNTGGLYALRSAVLEESLFGVTPAGKPTALTTAGAVVPVGGTGTAAGGWDTAANRDAAIATINTMRTRIGEIETKLQSLGLLT